ncbi:TetR family transcriptional regulator [Actinocorallia herbida]|uniref:TetR family transcriptional regulator n=1 Tax=Actinocorallia herbida TaxID=58109 RepID=A0A3N1CVH2_9ACTN|nr:TetR family transcriptional regulator [Actinocorallia herbida]ROO85234.1 TetR family transcriptional regulator [Actinocorallia herbida]
MTGTANDRPPDFQRARNAEQREARRQTILEAAAQLLAELPVGDISLRELSRRVGLSKTNVVRYFETREAVFFALLNQSLEQWIADLPADLPPAPAAPEAVADALARSLARRTLLCELLGSLGTELERNISAESARTFKLAHIRLLADLAALLQDHVPALTPSTARELVSLTVICTAGLWPFAHPSPAVAEAQRHPDLAPTKVDFPSRLSRALQVTLTGLLTLA